MRKCTVGARSIALVVSSVLAACSGRGNTTKTAVDDAALITPPSIAVDAAPVAALPPDAMPYRPVVIAAVGDLMLGTTYPDTTGARLPPNDGADLFSGVTDVLRAADLAFGNLEAPLYDGDADPHCTPGAIAEKGRGDGSCWSFRTPARYGEHVAAAGFDVVSLANNHLDDFGPDGRASTLQKLEAVGVAYTGPTGTVAHLTVRDAKVDVIAFATDANLNSMDDLETAAALVAKSAASADIVMVSFHGGAEGPNAMHVPDGAETYHGQHRGAVKTFSRAMVDAGADLVVGHGPHVVRGMEVYEGRLIAYSLGSFATYLGISVAGVRGRTMILEARLAADGALIDGRVISARQKRPNGPMPDDVSWLVAKLRSLSTADFGERAPTIADDGAIAPP
jgi:hypothetical protein